jgi:mono/diheme cytochrome c family protein
MKTETSKTVVSARRWAGAFGALLLSTIAAPAGAVGTAGQGESVVSRECRSCHLSAPAQRLEGQPPLFADIVKARTYQRGAFVDFLLRKPHYPMPPRGLTVEDVDNIVAYFETLGYWRD